jgi:hypothetical protein
MPLDIQLLDTQLKGLVNPEIYGIPLLANPAGVIGFFSSQDAEICWPFQGTPDDQNQSWFNRAPSAIIPYLKIGNLAASDAYDPLWSAQEEAFLLQKNSNDFISTTDLTHFNFLANGFLEILWFKPTPAFSTVGNQILFGKYSGNSTGNPYSLWISNGALYSLFSNDVAPAFAFATAALPISAFAGNIQVALSWKPINVNSAIAKIYLNGVVVVTGNVPFGNLSNGPLFSIGNPVIPCDIFLKQFYVEDLTVSGNNPDARVALDYKKTREILI